MQELKDDPIKEIRGLLEYLKFPINDKRLECIEQHSSGSFQRKRHQDDDDPWSQELHTVINDKVDIANKMLINKIGRALPLDKYEYYINVQ